ncbi:hypothetical protein BYT27DRAFT_6516884 [Phlegmacium glaucopus]|nr:hypothetical protein BYT27DRAFT_6516884 [Phlegmacium glaucopus]
MPTSRSYSAQEYLLSAFIHHCSRASTDSAILKGDLMQISDLRPCCVGIGQRDFYHGLPSLFDWLYKADTAAKGLSSHFQLLFDQHITTMLNEYKINGSNVGIAGLVFFPFPWNSPWFSMISGISRVPDIFPFDSQYLLGDEERSMVSPDDNEIFNPYPFIMGIERPDAKLFMSLTEDVASRREILVPHYRQGLDAVSNLLLKAAPLTDLYICLRDHPLQNLAKAKVHCEHGFATLRLAVKVYLNKVNIFVRKFSEVGRSIFLGWIPSRSLGFTSGHLMSDGPSSPTVSLGQVICVNSMTNGTKSCDCDNPGHFMTKSMHPCTKTIHGGNIGGKTCERSVLSLNV